MVAGEDATPSAPQPAAWNVAAGTALVYGVVGWLALLLAVPPGYAAPLYPSAGIALAAVLTYGRAAVPGVMLGGFVVNVVLSASRGQIDAAALWTPAVIGIGAALQAAAGAALIRRRLPRPLVLAAPREIALGALLGAALACVINATLATFTLHAAGAIGSDDIVATWGTWWAGDVLGVLIGAPLMLTLIGQPRADWAPRRRTVGLPLLLATLLLATATLVVSRWDNDRQRASFARDADRVANEAESRLGKPLHALQALNSAYLAAAGLTQDSLAAAARWWLDQPLELQAMGFSARVARADVPAFEARVRAQGVPAYRVFERDTAARADSDVVAIRFIAPLQGNAGALGVNALSIPAARQAITRTRDTGEPAVSAGFGLTQSRGDETGVVLYQAVYEGQPRTLQARREQFRGVVFVTVRAERLLAGVAGNDKAHLQWCLVDVDPSSVRPRLAGPPGCEQRAVTRFERRKTLTFASRPLQMRIFVGPHSLPVQQQLNAWLFSVTGALAAAMLGALLLTVTGRARRIELAVDERTAELRREVAERTHAEQALRDSEDRLRNILDNVPIGLMFLDTDGRIVETNPHLCAMLGRPAALLLRSTLDEISHPDEQADNRRLLTQLLAHEVEISRRQSRLLRADGQSLWVRMHVTLLRDAQGQPARLAGAVEDITEHLRLEASERALDMAEAQSRAKSEFVSRMSHELRTPLNAMIGFGQLLGLDRNPPLAPHQHEWTGQIQRAGWHLLEMINDTLDLARIESGAVQLALKPLQLDAMVAASLALVSNAARQRSVTLRDELAPAARAVLADETRLKQVLTNLLSNAVKYNREGGLVLLMTALDAEGRVEITVRDNGLGMTPEQMAALFQPYNRLGREHSGVEGTGIGLVISRRLAELMGGSLEAASVAGEGSVFTLRLPASDLAAVPAAAFQPSGPGRYQQRLVHYVEDNETNIEVMRGVLSQRPQIVLEVSMIGLDGLSAIRHRRPDLILLDMQLPDISGLELLRHLKQDDDVANIPVIVVSADATTARMQEALTLGAAHYVTKPVEIARFLSIVDETLSSVDTRWGV